MDRRVPVQRRYLAPLSGQHPERFGTPPSCPATPPSLPLLVLPAPQKLAIVIACGIRSPAPVRWPSRLTSCSLFPPLNTEDQGQDMIRLLAAPQHSASIALAPSRSISWRTSTKPEQFSSGAPWCSWTTTGSCTVRLVDKNRHFRKPGIASILILLRVRLGCRDLLPSKALRRIFFYPPNRYRLFWVQRSLTGGGHTAVQRRQQQVLSAGQSLVSLGDLGIDEAHHIQLLGDRQSAANAPN